MKKSFDLRCPTDTPFAYIEGHYSDCTEQEAYEAYVSLMGICRGGIGLTEAEWRGTLDQYMTGGGCSPEVFYRCNQAQQTLLTEIKKSQTRLGIRGKKT